MLTNAVFPYAIHYMKYAYTQWFNYLSFHEGATLYIQYIYKTKRHYQTSIT